MKIDGDIEPTCAQTPAERNVAEQSAPSARSRRDDHIVEVRTAEHDRRGRGFDDVRKVCVGKGAAQCANRGRGEDHVADLPKPDKEDLHRVIG